MKIQKLIILQAIIEGTRSNVSRRQVSRPDDVSVLVCTILGLVCFWLTFWFESREN